jgi:hypothetical protein
LAGTVQSHGDALEAQVALISISGQPNTAHWGATQFTTVCCYYCSEVIKLQQTDQLWGIFEVFQLEPHHISSSCPEDISKLIEQYHQLFEKPSGLPPPRHIKHSIPLIVGAQPFRLRPYRYNPAQKDEIEKQVQELLDNGLIRESTSPFASPVLLVKKKTGDWRMCVDYRKLNALTIQNKYPLPVIDEILDELTGAQWFTSLDMTAGYHQILMNEDDQFKIAFQTHNRHFEYTIMTYGVTGGPATFQQPMNYILAPLLRKGVVVFIDDILIYSNTWSD